MTRPVLVRRLAARAVLGFAVTWLASSAAADNPPKKTLKINFDSTAEFTESCGTTGTATASGLTAAQKTAVINAVQADFDRALGDDQVNVSAGSGGDADMIVNGGRAPGALEGTEWGDSGKPGEPAITHEGEFTDAGLSGDDLVKAMAETITHEFGHKCGLGHNWDEPNTIMTAGGKVTLDERKAGTRQLNADDKKKLEARPKARAQGEQKDSVGPRDLRHDVGERIGEPKNLPDDLHLDCAISIDLIPPGTDIGYVSTTGEFIFQADETNMIVPTYFSFLYSAGTNMAVRSAAGTLFTLDQGAGTYSVSNPNPSNLDLFTTANLFFDTPDGPVAFTLDAVFDMPQTGGFHASAGVPVPALSTTGLASLALLVGAAGVLFLRRAA